MRKNKDDNTHKSQGLSQVEQMNINTFRVENLISRILMQGRINIIV